MKVHFDYSSFHVPKPVITTGVFDGVHKGHVEILSRLNKSAASLHGESVVVTFWPHPRMVLKQDKEIKLLNTLEEKLVLLEKTGVQHVMVIPFTEEFSRISSDRFVRDILVEKLKVIHYIVGYNHHFGNNREGNFGMMSSFAQQFGFTLEKLDPQIIENEKVSSTVIRRTLNEGNIHSANNFLGYDYMLTGTVVEGKKIGRTLGFPTANVKVNNDFKLVPRTGVYAVEVDVDGIRYPAMLNIGFRPTIEAIPKTMTIEVHILNFSQDLYQKEITLFFKHHIRNEIKFAGLEHLKKQLDSDKGEISKLLGA